MGNSKAGLPPDRKIGGFLELDLPLASPAGRSAWQVMTRDDAGTLSGRTARSVLSVILQAVRPGTIWYPAYCCPEMVLGPGDAQVRFFPVGPSLRPDPGWLEPRLEPGDAVIVIDYFGCVPEPGVRALAATRPDVFWIEDCAQALLPEIPWGDWLLFSPRKLFGVADGGLGICRNPEKALSPARPARPRDTLTDLARLAPILWRFEDRAAAANDIWYQAFRDGEALSFGDGLDSAPADISQLTRRLLQSIDGDRVIAARRANAACLHDCLPPRLRFWSDCPSAPLLGYPVLLQDRDTVAARLAHRGIFCPVHWRSLLAPAAEFPDEHALSATILTLPCDQRYRPADMTGMVDALLECL